MSAQNIQTALSLLGCKQYEEARSQFQSILTNNPNNHIALNGLGKVYKALGQYGEAMRAFKSCLEININFTAATSELAEIYLDQGMFNELRQLWDSRQEIPRMAHIQLVKMYRISGNMDLALAQFKKALAKFPHDPELYKERGSFYEDQYKFELAANDYLQAYNLNPNDPAPIEGYLKIRNYLKSQDQPSIEKLKQSLCEIFIKSCQQEIKVATVNGLQKKRYQLAIHHLDKASENEQKCYYVAPYIDLREEKYQISVGRGFSYGCLQCNDQAIIHFRQALSIKNNDEKVNNRLGLILHKERKYDEALRCFEMSNRLDSKKTPNFLINMGISYFMLKNFNLAQQCFKEANRLFPKHHTLFTCREFTDALTKIRGAIGLEDNSVPSQKLLLSMILEKQCHYDTAIKMYDQLVLDPKFYLQAYIGQARCHLEKSQPEPQTAECILKKCEKSFEACFLRGLLKMKSSKPVQALECFEQAYKLVSDYDDSKSDSTNSNSEQVDSVKSDGSLKKSKSEEPSNLEETYGLVEANLNQHYEDSIKIELYIKLFTLHRKLRDVKQDELVKYLELAQQIDPSSLLIEYYWAKYLHHIGNLEEAKNRFLRLRNADFRFKQKQVTYRLYKIFSELRLQDAIFFESQVDMFGSQFKNKTKITLRNPLENTVDYGDDDDDLYSMADDISPNLQIHQSKNARPSIYQNMVNDESLQVSQQIGDQNLDISKPDMIKNINSIGSDQRQYVLTFYQVVIHEYAYCRAMEVNKHQEIKFNIQQIKKFVANHSKSLFGTNECFDQILKQYEVSQSADIKLRCNNLMSIFTNALPQPQLADLVCSSLLKVVEDRNLFDKKIRTSKLKLDNQFGLNHIQMNAVYDSVKFISQSQSKEERLDKRVQQALSQAIYQVQK